MEHSKTKTLLVHGDNNELQLEEFDDTLSLKDLPIHDHEEEEEEDDDDDDDHCRISPSSPNHSADAVDRFFDFEFSVISKPTFDDIIFCGKIIPQKHPQQQPTTKNVDNNNNLLNKTSRSYSFHAPPSSRSSKGCSTLPATRSYRYPTSKGSSGRKQKVLIGLAKIPSHMDLTDIKKRQSRRKIPASPMFPAVNGDHQLALICDGGEVGGGGGSVSGYRCLFQPFRSGSKLIGELAKASFGCFPHV